MLMGGDYDLNLPQVHTDSLKEILRQTILNQEVIFRKQVNELHRLYVTQKTLMKDRGWRELNGYKLGNAGTHSTLGPFSEQLRCEPLATEKMCPSIFPVGSSQSVQSNSLQEGRSICPKLQQRPLDLQPLSSNCMNYIGGDFPVAGNNWDYIGKFNGGNHYFHCDSVYRPEEVKLSLSIGEDSTKKSVGRKPLTDKISCAFSPDIIDLEESTEMVSNDDGQSVFSLRCDRINSGHNKHDSQVPAQSIQNVTDIPVKDPSDAFAMIDTSIGSNGICHEQNFSKKGLSECDDDVPCDNMFTNGKLFTSNVVIDLDLNKIQLDESSSHANDAMLAYPSAASSSGDAILGSRDSNSNSNSNSSNVLATIPKSNAESGNKTCSIDLESMSELQSGISEETGNHRRNMDISSNFQNGNHIDIARPEVNGGKVNEDISLAVSYRSQTAVGDAHCNGYPASCKCDCTADDNPSITRTMQSGTDLGGSCLSPSNMIQKIESSQVTETAYQPDLRSSGNSEMKHQSSDKKKGKSAEIDNLVQTAAASLIHISLENPVSNHDFTTKSGSNEIEGNERKQPAYSSDSYESMVLKLTETSADDYCVSSNAFEVNELDKKDSPIKLKRGRRLKDFQKDILPGLASLSRHEICEDINIMEGVMKSREYKRLRSKAANGGNWFTPVRSRRSRLNYVGRRYYS